MNFSIRPLHHTKSKRTGTNLPLCGLITLFATGLLAATARADRPATFWSTTSGDFHQFGNWNLGLPSTAVDARIDNGGTAIINSEAFQSVAYVYLGSEQNTSGTLEVATGGIANFTSMIVGALNATGTLNIHGGGQLGSFGGAIGSDYLGVGVATIKDDTSSWKVFSSEMVVGGNGNGTLRVQEGGSVTVANGDGRIQLGNHPVSEGNLYIGNGGAVGTVSASEIYNGEGRATVTFNHNEAAYSFAPRFTGQASVNGYLNIRHEGTGTTILAAPTSSLAGVVTVASGALMVTGAITGHTREVTVEDEVFNETTVGEFVVLDGGTLGGTGFIEGNTTVVGNLSPGMSVGILEFGGDLSLTAVPDTQGNGPSGAGTVKLEIGGLLRGVSYDGVNVAGTLHYGGTLSIVLLDGFRPNDGATFNLFDGFEAYAGNFENILFSSEGYAGQFNPETGILSVSTVPEPGVLGLAVVGMAALGLRRRRNVK